MQRHLFVYGTLMTLADGAGLGRAMRARLQRDGKSLGAATMAGQLYNLGRYPGLVSPADAGDVVHGEIFRLGDPAGVLAWLDDYENARPDDPGTEYARVLRMARLASGEATEAWVYLYRGNPAGMQRLSDGRWRPL